MAQGRLYTLQVSYTFLLRFTGSLVLTHNAVVFRKLQLQKKIGACLAEVMSIWRKISSSVSI